MTLIFFAAMFLFDLTTTAINNYIDTKTNAQTLQFKRSIALAIIFVLLGTSTILGLYLVYLTDIVVLLLGGLCFSVRDLLYLRPGADFQTTLGGNSIGNILRIFHPVYSFVHQHAGGHLPDIRLEFSDRKPRAADIPYLYGIGPLR